MCIVQYVYQGIHSFFMFIALFSLIFPVVFKVVYNSFRVTIDDSSFALFPSSRLSQMSKALKKKVPEEMSIISVLAFY
jgi:hypothetical protein